MGRWGESPYRGDKAVPVPGQRFDEARRRRVIPQSLAQSFDGTVDAVLEINEGILRPELLSDLFAGHQLARTLQQHGQDLEGLTVQLDLQSVLAQFSCTEIDFEDTEMYPAGTTGIIVHGGVYPPSLGEVYHFMSSPERQSSKSILEEKLHLLR